MSKPWRPEHAVRDYPRIYENAAPGDIRPWPDDTETDAERSARLELNKLLAKPNYTRGPDDV